MLIRSYPVTVNGARHSALLPVGTTSSRNLRAGAGRDGGGGRVEGSRTAESSQAAAEPAPASAATAGSEEGQRLPEPRLHRVGRALLVLAAAYWALSSGAGGKVALEDLDPRNFRAKPKNPPSRHLVWLSQVGFGFGLGFFLFLGGGG